MKPKTLAGLLLPAILAVICVSGGCFKLSKPFPQKRSFLIQAPRPHALPAPVKGTVISVHRFRVSPQFEAKGFVYRKSDVAYESDFYNEFFISPGAMLSEEVRGWLAGSGLFHQVTRSSGYAAADYVLKGEVTALYGDYTSSNSPVAVLGIRFFVVHNVSPQPGLFFEKHYHEEIPLKQDTAEALVRGWSEALKGILTVFEEDLKACTISQKGFS
jgi:cholesterol transport system auxiliary component